MTSLKLGEPIGIGSVEMRNRIVLAPISTNYGDERGYATDRSLSFYEERARGGAGLLIFEATSVSPGARIFGRGHALHDDSFVAGLAEVTRRVHDHGARVFAQLCHGGPKAISAFNDGAPLLSASDVPVQAVEAPRPMTHGEITQAIEDFAAAAVRAREAGFDGIELHAAHFYLLSAFLSGYLNRRIDEYGGTVENRARLACQVIRAVKDSAGDDYPVMCRFNGRERLPGGIDEAEARQIGRLLAAAGADALHVSASVAERHKGIEALYAVPVGGPPSKDTPHGLYVEFAAAVKPVVHVPVVAVGKLNDPATAEQVLQEGKADMVAIGRGLIADPYLPAKMVEGNWDSIDRCKECLTCHTTLRKQRPVECSVNPHPWEPKR